MKSIIQLATLISLLPSILALTINTPSGLIPCQPILLTWADGTPPYFLSLIPGGQPSAPAIKTFPTQAFTSYTWTVDLQPGTQFNIDLKDSTGTQAFSDTVTVQSGSDTSCVGANSSVNASSVAVSSTVVSPTSGTGTQAATGTSAGKPSESKTGTGASSSQTASSKANAGSRSSVATYGLVGLMGLVGAALF